MDGSVLLPNQWSLHPTGRQIELADFPVNLALHPMGDTPPSSMPGIASTKSLSLIYSPAK